MDDQQDEELARRLQEEEDDPPIRRRKRSRHIFEWEPFPFLAVGIEDADRDLKECFVCRNEFQDQEFVVCLTCCKSTKRLHYQCARTCLRFKHECPICGQDNVVLSGDAPVHSDT